MVACHSVMTQSQKGISFKKSVWRMFSVLIFLAHLKLKPGYKFIWTEHHNQGLSLRNQLNTSSRSWLSVGGVTWSFSHSHMSNSLINGESRVDYAVFILSLWFKHMYLHLTVSKKIIYLSQLLVWYNAITHSVPKALFPQRNFTSPLLWGNTSPISARYQQTNVVVGDK